MKRTVLFLFMAFCAISMISAHGKDRPGHNSPPGGPPRFNRNHDNSRNIPRPNTEIVRISGNLTVARGMIALNSGDVIYLAAGLGRFTGFIEGLKEGAAATLEGRVVSGPNDNNVRFMHVQKMTLNGKDYDVALPGMPPNPMQHRMPPDRNQDHRRGGPRAP